MSSRRKSLFGTNITGRKSGSFNRMSQFEEKICITTLVTNRKSTTIGTPLSFDLTEEEPTKEELLEREELRKKLSEYFPNSSKHFNKDATAESSYLCNVDKILASYLLSSSGYEYLCKSGYIRDEMTIKEFPSVPVKLIIQNSSDDKEEKSIFHFSKSKEKYKDELNLGEFPVRLCIGPWIFYWNYYSLCIPKIQKGSRHAIMCLTLGNIELNEKTLIDICEFIKLWNCSMKYSSEHNSYFFCLELLKVLNIKLNISNFNGCLKEYLIKASNKDKVKMNYYIPDDILKKEKKRKLYFQSHEELDIFVLQILKEHPNFKNEFPNDWELLKGIDEAFWLRHYKARCKLEDLDEINFKIPNKNCPFGDPRDKGSYLNPSQKLSEKFTVQ
eukprot:gene5203-8809_t